MSRYIVWEGMVWKEIYKLFLYPSESDIIVIESEGMPLDVNGPCPCGSGKKQKKCHRELHGDSVVAKLWKKMNELDAQLSGYDTYCRAGCSECCKEYFYVSAAEYFLIKNHLLTFSPDFFVSAKELGMRQFALLRDRVPKEYQKLLTPPAHDGNEFNDRANLRQFEPCVMLDPKTGMCEVYPARTLICRLYGSSSLFEYCAEIREHIAAFDDIDRIMSRIKYDEKLTGDVDHFMDTHGTRVHQRPYPLVYWLAQDAEYESAYEKAISRPMNEYIQHLLAYR